MGDTGPIDLSWCTGEGVGVGGRRGGLVISPTEGVVHNYHIKTLHPIPWWLQFSDYINIMLLRRNTLLYYTEITDTEWQKKNIAKIKKEESNVYEMDPRLPIPPNNNQKTDYTILSVCVVLLWGQIRGLVSGCLDDCLVVCSPLDNYRLDWLIKSNHSFIHSLSRSLIGTIKWSIKELVIRPVLKII